MKTMIVQEPNKLLDYLRKTLANHKRNRIKQFLKFKLVSVNGQVITRHDHPLSMGDKVCVQTDNKPTSKKGFLRSLIDIAYEDDAVIVVNKPSGLLAISTEKIRTETMYHKVNEYLNALPPFTHYQKKVSRPENIVRHKEKRIFVVHRLDKDASGLLVFAKSHEVKHELQNNWGKVEKRYFAIVEGVPEKKSGTIESFLKENKYLKVYSSDRPIEKSKYSITHYQVLRSTRENALLEIRLETGRKHQIRVHLASIGHSIVGDEKYGNGSSKRRLSLHACYLAFEHPITKEKMTFQSKLPDSLEKIMDPPNTSLSPVVPVIC